MKNKIFFLFLIISLIGFGKEVVELINEGVVYLKMGDYKKAIEIFENAKRTASQNPDIYYYLGETYFRIGDTQKAVSNLQKAIDINPQKQSYHYTLALVYLSQNKNKEAMESLDRVLKISSLSLYGKEAERLKKELEKRNVETEVVKKWEKIEIEEKSKKEETKETKKEEVGQETQKEEKIPVGKLIKRIKFGTEDVRKTTSGLLLQYSPSEISQVINDIIEIISKEKIPEIRKNLIIVSGKVNSPEVIDMLLSIIKNEKESFDIKIISLDTLENLQKEKVVPELRRILEDMTEKREKAREEARKNLQQITQQLNSFVSQRDKLNSEIEKLNNRKNEIDGLLTPSPEWETKSISEKERQKLQTERDSLEEKINKNNNELQKINKEISELERKKGKYELLLKKKEIDISGIGSSAVIISTETPPGEEVLEGPRISFTQADEEKNEIIFAVKLMIFLSNARDKESLSIIKKAWREFGVKGLSIYYDISLGKLGEYRNINGMVARLKKNYPGDNLEEEINIRKNIVEVLGDYIKEKPDEEIKGLIEYLAEESEYPQIKTTAQKVMSSIGKKGI